MRLMMQDRGLIPRVFQELFAQIEEKRQQQVHVNTANCHRRRNGASFLCVGALR